VASLAILLISFSLSSNPISASGENPQVPGGVVTVAPGDVFLLRHELHFDNLARGGYFTMAIAWRSPSSDDNFTLESAPSVTWISGPENGSPVENVVYDNLYVNIGGGTDGWEVWVKIPAENKV